MYVSGVSLLVALFRLKEGDMVFLVLNTSKDQREGLSLFLYSAILVLQKLEAGEAEASPRSLALWVSEEKKGN